MSIRRKSGFRSAPKPPPLAEVNSAPPPIVILSPTLGPRKGLAAVIKTLEQAGYVAIIAEPEQVKIMDTVTIAPTSAITRAALRAIRSTDHWAAKLSFSNNLCDALAPKEPPASADA